MRAKLIVLVLTMALVACGSGDEGAAADQIFRDDRFAFTFEYPGTLEPAELETSVTREGEQGERATLALDDQDLIVVAKYEIGATVPKGDLDPAVTEELNGVVEDLVGRPVDGRPIQIAGLPAVEYDTVDVPNQTADLQSRLVYIFDGNVEYQINCQWTPEKREQIARACAQVLSTLKPV